MTIWMWAVVIVILIVVELLTVDLLFASLAIAAMASISVMFIKGLVGVSTQISLVLAVTAVFTFAGLVVST